MEGEVSGIAKLGIVLIALAVLIGLGFGIFQISKGTANTGVNNVQKELDGVSTSQFTSYDQTTITGQMVRSAVSDFEGEQTAVLISTQAWINWLKDNNHKSNVGIVVGDYPSASGISAMYGDGNVLPVVWAFSDKAYTETFGVSASDGTASGTGFHAAFVNYNAIIGTKSSAAGTNSHQPYKTISGITYDMANIYFDQNCFRCVTGFLADSSGKVQYNNIVKNIQLTGTTEFVPTGAKFNAYLIKDASGTIMGIACQQIGS